MNIGFAYVVTFELAKTLLGGRHFGAAKPARWPPPSDLPSAVQNHLARLKTNSKVLAIEQRGSTTLDLNDSEMQSTCAVPSVDGTQSVQGIFVGKVECQELTGLSSMHGQLD